MPLPVDQFIFQVIKRQVIDKYNCATTAQTVFNTRTKKNPLSIADLASTLRNMREMCVGVSCRPVSPQNATGARRRPCEIMADWVEQYKNEMEE